MKNLTIAVAVLAVAVVALFVLQFTGKKSTSSSVSGEVVEGTITPTEGSVVYVHMDSLLNGFDMYHDLKNQLEEKVKKVQGDLDVKARALQRDYADLNEKANKGLITRSQGQEKADELRSREQQLMQQGEKARTELDEEQGVVLNQINEAIKSYVKTYNATKGYSLIISTSGSIPVLWGNPGLDITADLVKGLNEEYIKTKQSKPQDSKPAEKK